MEAGRSASHRGDRALAAPPAHHAVVVEDRDPVSGEPDVGLQPGRPEPQGQGERVQGVLRGVRPGPPVGEADRRVDERRIAGHATRGIIASGPGGAPSRPPVGQTARGRFRRLRVVLAIFNSLGGGEVIAILVIGLIVLGPEKLPDAIRKFGNIYGELRRMSQGFQSELRDAFDEPMRELRGTAQMMQDAVNEPVRSVKSPDEGTGGGRRGDGGPRRGERRGGRGEAEVAEEAQPRRGQAPVEEAAGPRRGRRGAGRRSRRDPGDGAGQPVPPRPA